MSKDRVPPASFRPLVSMDNLRVVFFFYPRRYNTSLMGATDKRSRSSPRSAITATPRAEDPRVVRTRAAVVDAARALFLQQGYAGTTMEQIAARAGLTKRTVYNNYGDKDALFTQIVADVLSYAETFTRRLHEEFDDG